MYNFSDLNDSENRRVQELAEKLHREGVHQNASYLMSELQKNTDSGELFEDILDAVRKTPEELWDEIVEIDHREAFAIVAEEFDEDFVNFDEAFNSLDSDAISALADLYLHENGDNAKVGLSPREMIDEILESMSETDLCVELGITPNYEFDIDENGSEVLELAESLRIEEYNEVYEWWIVSEWMQSRLSSLGCVTFDLYGLPLWGRCATGQSMLLDGAFQSIAREMLEDDFKKEREAAKLEQEAREAAAPGYGQELLQALANSQ